MRFHVLWLSAALAAGCGGTAASSHAPIDEDRLADEVAERVAARLERDEQARRAETAPSPAAAEIGPGARVPPPDVQRFRVPARHAPSRGAELPLVTLVQFSDFECPFCKRVLPTLERLQRKYPNELRIVFRNNPLPMHRHAKQAAAAAVEAYTQGGDEKFWQMHDLLFENQRALGRADLERYARQIGLDLADFGRALDRGMHDSTIRQDQQIAERLGARGTPAHFLNGRKLMGAQPFEEFEAIVREEIALARRMMERGVEREQLYATLMSDARQAAPEPSPSPSPSRARKEPDPDAVYHVPVGREPRRGPRGALVTIVEFADFECPFCARVQPTLDKIREEYGNDVRIVFMNNPLPFHRNADEAAIAAQEAFEQGGNRKFWKLHDLLFENQRDLDRQKIEELAKKVGLNMRRLERALERESHLDVIEKQQELANELGATGTPSFFINGRNLRGAQPYEAFEEVIDEELQKAKEMVRNGVPRSRLYEKIIEDGATEPQYVDDGQGGGGGGGTADGYDIEPPENAPSRGSDDAAVTIQLWSDFQCPFCERVRPTVERVMQEFDGRVRLVWRNYPLPFHQHAQLAAEAALEIHAQGGDEAFWAYHDLLFDNQQALSRTDLERYAKQLGHVDMARFERALDRHIHRDRIEADKKAVKDAGMRIGTPAFLIGGQLVMGAQSFSAFEKAIEEELHEGGDDDDDD